MNTATLVLYFTLAGSMQVSKVPQPDLETCQREAQAFMQLKNTTMQPKHAECKAKKVKAAKPQATALNLKAMT